MLPFDEAAARAIERIYQTPDVVGQRVRVLDALDLRPGQRVLDVGSGPGLLLREMAASVGEGGRAFGIDSSEAMIAVATARCADQPQAELRRGDATALPFDDGSLDAVSATQVYEYVKDLPAALGEALRVLRPGGRLVVLDTDWSSVVWNTADHARLRRVLDAWEEHLHDPHLPARLGPLLEGAGFQVLRREVIPILNCTYHAHCYSFGILAAIQAFVPGRRGVTREEADAWATELRGLEARGEYFFSINRYLFAALRPGGRQEGVQ
jgi:ubiquinone/menaquinone biosynthesis C-methylase UbiE